VDSTAATTNGTAAATTSATASCVRKEICSPRGSQRLRGDLPADPACGERDI
jgi:hypothetical protein